jgi:hypothetical protein
MSAARQLGDGYEPIRGSVLFGPGTRLCIVRPTRNRKPQACTSALEKDVVGFGDIGTPLSRIILWLLRDAGT